MKAVSILPVLLAASFVSLAQNPVSDRFVSRQISCALSSAGAPVANATCPGPPPPSGGWSFVQVGWWSNFGAQSGPGGGQCFIWTNACTVNFAQPLQPGDVLIVLPLTYTGGVQSVLTSISGESITMCNACQTQNGSVIQIGIGYNLSVIGGESQFTCFFNVAPSGWMGCGYVVARWSGTGGVTFDTGGSSVAPCSTSCPGINLNLSSPNDFVLQIDFPLNTDPLSVTSGWNFIQGSYAYELSPSNGKAPAWFLPMSDPATSNAAIAFTGH